MSAPLWWEDRSYAKPARPKGNYQAAWDAHWSVHPAEWCVTKKQILDFGIICRQRQDQGQIPLNPKFPNPFHNDPKIGPSMHLIRQHVIEPITKMEGNYRSWALWKNPRGQKGKVSFITHNWNEGVYEFCDKMARLEEALYWICFLANPQAWEFEDLKALLGNEPQHSPFALALPVCNRMWALPNKTESIYDRLWCVYEAYIALTLRKDVVVLKPRSEEIDVEVPVSGGGSAEVGAAVREFLKKSPQYASYEFTSTWSWSKPGQQAKCRLTPKGGDDLAKQSFTSVRNAKCSDANDERTIRAAIRGKEAEIDAMVRSLRQEGNSFKVYDGGLRMAMKAGDVNEGKDPLSKVQACFKNWDKNGDGRISEPELAAVMTKLDPNFTSDMTHALFMAVDCNRDGRIDLKEFTTFIFRRGDLARNMR